MAVIQDDIQEIARNCQSRGNFWVNFLNSIAANRVAELGVYKGDFAQKVLADCESIQRYYMIDPWRYLDNWNKPANKDNSVFAAIFSEAMNKTEFAAEKRVVLRGKTTEIIHKIADSELDFAYVDGDHTLRGITIDLVRMFPKVKQGGWLGGDDFSPTIWQHSTKFEPTLVFPFAVYFAEAMGAELYVLPNSQFLMRKNESQSFSLTNLTENCDYRDLDLKAQLNLGKIVKLKTRELARFYRKTRKLISEVPRT